MKRTFILINTNSNLKDYPKVFYCNGCNVIGESVLETFKKGLEISGEPFTLVAFEFYIIDYLGMARQENQPIEWLGEADDFFIVFFDEHDRNPSIRYLADEDD